MALCKTDWGLAVFNFGLEGKATMRKYSDEELMAWIKDEELVECRPST